MYLGLNFFLCERRDVKYLFFCFLSFSILSYLYFKYLKKNGSTSFSSIICSCRCTCQSNIFNLVMDEVRVFLTSLSNFILDASICLVCWSCTYTSRYISLCCHCCFIPFKYIFLQDGLFGCFNILWCSHL